MKKKIICFVLIMINLVLLLSACNNNNEEEKGFELQYYNKPSDLPDYALTIEWVNGEGNATQFLPHRPTMILFNGVSEYDKKDDFVLPTEIYYYDSGSLTKGALGSKSQNINRNLAYYWYRMGFNVGIFHYENFAFDTPSDINKRIYDKTSMTYKNVDGEVKTSNTINYNLTEAFVMEWLKLMVENPIKGSIASRIMEVRFVGNSSGVNLAISAAKYLYDLFENGHTDGLFVANRISILNPYFDNKIINIPVTHRINVNVESILAYNNNLVKALSQKGMVFDMVESDSEYYLSYESPYSGALLIEGDEDGENEYRLENSGDIKLYNEIVESTAYLEFSESYSTNMYTDEYRKLDRAVRDWYLYTINGSDNLNDLSSYTSLYGHASTAPMIDGVRAGGSSSIPRLAVSAWTPTSYTRALRGAKFTMQRADKYENSAWVHEPYTMTKMEAEAYQLSDLKGATLCGYVYWMKDESFFVNYAYNTRLADVEITITIEVDSVNSITNTLTTKTNAEGYYSIVIAPEYYGKTCKIVVAIPNRNYVYSQRLADPTEYDKMSISSLEATSNSITIYESEVPRAQIYVRNCGFARKEA